MSELALMQEALERHKKETDKRYEKMETHVANMVDKVHEGALAFERIATKLNDVPHDRHLAEHDFVRADMKATKRRDDFWHALTLSLASRFGWKLFFVTVLLLVGLIWHQDEIREWVFNEFLKKEAVEVVSK